LWPLPGLKRRKRPQNKSAEGDMNRKFVERVLIGILVILVVLMIPAVVSAQGSDPTDDDVNVVAKQLYCPVCENIPLDACGTAACEQWRGIIRDKLAEGWTEDQIKDYFVAQYGDRVLAEPPRKGFNWLIYVVPVLVFVGGGVLLYRGFDQWKAGTEDPRRDGNQTPKSGSAMSDDQYISRVERELKKRSGGTK
jgi:cytochrome c-type biogenesis protein CcmH